MTSDQRYENWFSDEGTRILHLHGKTGCGKTNLLGYLAFALRLTAPKTIVFTYSFSKAYPARASLRGFLLDFVLQLLVYLPSIYNTLAELPQQEEIQFWTTQVLWATFRRILLCTSRPRILCLIDNFERFNSSQRTLLPKILAALDEHQVEAPHTDVPAFKLLLISEKCEAESAVTEFHACINLEQEKGLTEDRDRIVTAAISRLIDKRPVLLPYSEKLKRKLCAPGITILQVNLHITMFEICIDDSTPNCINREIDAIPRALDECYETILASMSQGRNSFTGKVFSWMFYAARMLQQRELATALAINLEKGTFDKGDISGDIISDLKNVVGPLVTATGDEIDFSHSSFREYIPIRGRDRNPGWGFSHFNHNTTASWLLLYLQEMLPKGGGQDLCMKCTVDGVPWLDALSIEGMGFLQYAITVRNISIYVRTNFILSTNANYSSRFRIGPTITFSLQLRALSAGPATDNQPNRTMTVKQET